MTALFFAGCPQPDTNPPDANLTADIVFLTETYTSGTMFDPVAWQGDGTARETWRLTALEQGVVYFAVTKEPAQTITVAGTDAGKVMAAATVEGLMESDTLAVFAVETGDALFGGGTRTFDLDVQEEGKTEKTVAVTVEVNPKTDTAVFIVTRENGVETQTRQNAVKMVFDNPNNTTNKWKEDTAYPVETFFEAIKWVDIKAQDNTEYLIRLTAEEEAIPKIVLYCSGKDNVTIRLRGAAGSPKVLKGKAREIGSGYSYFLEYGDTWYYCNTDVEGSKGDSGFSRDLQNGLINIGWVNESGKPDLIRNITVKLEENFTLQGMSITTTNYWNNLVQVNCGGVLAMEKGSVIRDFNKRGGSAVDALIRINAYLSPDQVSSSLTSGSVIVNGGSFINNTVGDGTNVPLIYFNGRPDAIWPGRFQWNSGTLSGNSSTGLWFSGYDEPGRRFDMSAFTSPVSLPEANE